MDQYTWVSARTELLRRLGGRNDATTTLRANEWMNSAQLTLTKSYIEFPRLEQVTTQVLFVAGQSEYNLLSVAPDLSDIIGIRAVRNEGLHIGPDTTNPIRMYRFPFGEYRALSTQAVSRPIRWSRNGNLFVVDPQPDDTYETRIDYRRRPRFETVELDSEWHQHWIQLALHYGWASLDQPDLALKAMQIVPQWLTRELQTPIQEEEWEQYWDTAGLAPHDAWIGGFKP